MTDIKEVIARVQRNLLCRTVDDFVLVKDTDLTYLIDAAEAGIAARDRIKALELCLRNVLPLLDETAPEVAASVRALEAK